MLLRVSAGWVLPVSAAPLRQGAVLVGEDGKVIAVGPDADIPRPADAETWDLPDSILLPGLVNAHSHHELTCLRGLVRNLPFPEWVAAVRRIKDGLGPEHFRASSRWGVLESFAAGITATGDTGSSGAPAMAMADLRARGVAYQEVFGPDPRAADSSITELERAFGALWPYSSARVAIGVSPHAPYTVSGELMRRTAAFARERSLKIATHVAESRAERELVESGTGPFAEALRRRGVAVEAQGCSSVAWLARHGVMDLAPLLIHCVTAGEHDFRFMARHSAPVAHCPQSNDALGNGRADLGAMRECGVTVGLGTDSVVAGGDMDLFAQARHAALLAPLSAREMLRLVTVDGARALGIEGAGVIEVGSWADLTVISLARPALAGGADPEETIMLGATAADVHFTWVAGHMVYKRGFWPGVVQDAERSAYELACGAARAARDQRSSRG